MWILLLVSFAAVLHLFVIPWWMEKCKKQWKLSLERFAKEHDGFKHDDDDENSKEHVLLILNPAA